MTRTLLILTLAAGAIHAADLTFYIGTYTRPGGSQGIYRGTLNPETGEMKTALAGEAKNPSFVALAPGGKFLYAAIEEGGGAVGAFAIENDGSLRKLNTESSKGSGNCHVWVDAAGKNVFAANYGSGTIAALPIQADGSLGAATASVQHKGSGPNTGRQKEPHAHAIVERGGFVYACDLGTDDVFIYKLDAAKGTLTPTDPPSGRVPAGGGPRHIAFRAQGGAAFVNNEMTSAVTAFAHDAKTGALTPLHTLSTLPADVDDAMRKKNSTAEIHCHPNGKFVYVSNRGHDSIAVFSIAADGKLTLVEIADAKVKVPRGFGISADGKWLVAGGQSSDSIAAHKINPDTGKLTFVSETKGVGQPVCVEFTK